MTDTKLLGHTAGALYLTLAALGGFAELAVRGTVRTAAAIGAHETLFRLGLAADVLLAAVFVALGLVLYRLFVPLHRGAATALLLFVVAGAVSTLGSLVFQAGALAVATEPGYGDGRESLVALLMRLHADGYALGGIFFGLWLLPVAFVTRRFGLLPPLFGPLLLVAGVAWLLDPVLRFALPDADLLRGLVSLPTVLGELGLMGYLLVRGVRRVAPAGRPERLVGAAG